LQAAAIVTEQRRRTELARTRVLPADDADDDAEVNAGSITSMPRRVDVCLDTERRRFAHSADARDVLFSHVSEGVFMPRFAAALSVCLLFTFAGSAVADDAPSRAGAIVKGKDEDAVADIMKTFNKALKVKCNFCHVREDGKFNYKKWTKHKRVALHMHTEYVAKLKNAEGGSINCNTCHQGRKTFLKKVAKGDE